jgi:hypothetical protein
MKIIMLNSSFIYPSIYYHPYQSCSRLYQNHQIPINEMQALRPSQTISYADSLSLGRSLKSRDDIKKNRKLSGITDSVRSSDQSTVNSKNESNNYGDHLVEDKKVKPKRTVNQPKNHGSLSRIDIKNLVNPI